MSVVGSIINCPNLQDQLNDEFGGLNGYPQPVDNLVNVLRSPANTQNVLQRQIAPTGSNKLRTVELLYQPRLIESEILETSVLNCDGGDAPGELSTEYTIQDDEGISHSWTITPNDLIRKCQTNESWFAQQIMRVMEGMKRKLDTFIAEKAVLNTGPFLDGTTNKNVNTIMTGADPSYEAIQEIRFAFAELDFNQAPLVLGFGEIYKYFQKVAAACCGDLGIDVGELLRQNQIGFFKDAKIPTAFGDADAFLAFAPGAIQMITYNEFLDGGWPVVINDDSFKQGVVQDPSNGIMYDYHASLSCGVWNFQLKLAADIAVLPSDLFQVDDPLDGVNWVQKFTVVNS